MVSFKVLGAQIQSKKTLVSLDKNIVTIFLKIDIFCQMLSISLSHIEAELTVVAVLVLTGMSETLKCNGFREQSA